MLRLPRLLARWRAPDPGRTPGQDGARALTIVSWNLLRRTGAGVDDLSRLVDAEQPDLLLMQEVTADLARLCERVGGSFVRAPMPARIHGLAVWSPEPLATPPAEAALPRGTLFRRVCQVVEIGGLAIANVHLSHGQVLNRRQLRRAAGLLPYRSAILGDFNIVGPHMVPGFRDVGPRGPTHLMADLVPLRLDRCLARGLVCRESRILARGRSDHRPILVRLEPETVVAPGRAPLSTGMGRPAGRMRPGAAARAFGR